MSILIYGEYPKMKKIDPAILSIAKSFERISRGFVNGDTFASVFDRRRRNYKSESWGKLRKMYIQNAKDMCEEMYKIYKVSRRKKG